MKNTLSRLLKQQNNKVEEKISVDELAYVYASVENLIALKNLSEKLSFPLRHKSRSQFSGAKQSSLRGRGLDFDEVRAYQAGDEIRAIDWRVTARTGEPHTKVYKEEKEKPVFVLLDLRKPMFFGSRKWFKSVTACQVASLLAWACVKHGDRFGALVFSEHQDQDIKPRTGNKAALSFIQVASEYSKALLQNSASLTAVTDNSVAELTLDTELAKLYQIIKPGSLIYIISDFHDLNDASQNYLGLLSRHNDLIAVNIHDPLEQYLPDSGRLLFTNESAQESQISEIQASNKKTRQAYQYHYEQKQNHKLALLLKTRVRSIEISTEQNAFEQLQQIQRPGRFV